MSGETIDLRLLTLPLAHARPRTVQRAVEMFVLTCIRSLTAQEITHLQEEMLQMIPRDPLSDRIAALICGHMEFRALCADRAANPKHYE